MDENLAAQDADTKAVFDRDSQRTVIIWPTVEMRNVKWMMMMMTVMMILYSFYKCLNKT